MNSINGGGELGTDRVEIEKPTFISLTKKEHKILVKITP